MTATKTDLSRVREIFVLLRSEVQLPYPKYDTTQIWASVPSQGLSDALIEQLNDELKDK